MGTDVFTVGPGPMLDLLAQVLVESPTAAHRLAGYLEAKDCVNGQYRLEITGVRISFDHAEGEKSAPPTTPVPTSAEAHATAQNGKGDG